MTVEEIVHRLEETGIEVLHILQSYQTMDEDGVRFYDPYYIMLEHNFILFIKVYEHESMNVEILFDTVPDDGTVPFNTFYWPVKMIEEDVFGHGQNCVCLHVKTPILEFTGTHVPLDLVFVCLRRMLF